MNGLRLPAVFLLFLLLFSPSSSSLQGETDSPPAQTVTSVENVSKLLKDGAYAEAEAGARSLLATQERTAPEDLKGRIEILDVLLQALHRLGKFKPPETMDLAKEAVDLSRRLYGEESPVFARSLHSLANIYFSRSDLDAALETFEQALAIRRKALGPDHPDVGATLNNLALIYQQRGDYAEALRLLEQSLAIREKALGPDHPDVATSLTNIGNQLVNLGDYQGAIEAQQRALAIREKALGPEHPKTAESLSNLGEAYYVMKDYKQARPLYERTLAIDEKAYGSEKANPYLAYDKSSLGKLLVELGDYPAGLSQLEEVLAIDERRRGPENAVVARDLETLSDVYAKVGRQASALDAAQRALSIEEKLLGAEHPETAVALETQASRYFEAAQYQKAIDALQRALAIVEKTLGPAHPEVGDVLVGIADAQVELGSLAEAGKNYERALSIQKEAFGPAHAKVGESLLKLARLNWKAGEFETALNDSLTSEGILRDQFIQVAPALSEREALRFETARSSGINLSISSMLATSGEARRQAIPKVWDEIIRSRALVLDQMAARHAAFTRSAKGEIAAKARALSAARNRLARLVTEGPAQDDPSDYRIRLNSALAEKEQSERELAGSSSEFQRRSQNVDTGFQDILRALPPQTALVAYLAYDRLAQPKPGNPAQAARPSYVAFILRAGDTSPVVLDLGEASSIDTQVQDWRSLTSAPPAGLARQQDTRLTESGTRLREAIWDPLARRLKGSHTLLIVADGALSLLNVAALPLDDGHYVVESGPTLHYLGAERDVARPGARRPAEGGLLALGGPDFDLLAGSSGASGQTRSVETVESVDAESPSAYRSAPIACAGFSSARFSPLAASMVEAKEISSIWTKSDPDGKRTVLLTGSAATEAAVKREAPKFRVVHLATHGYFLGDQCQSSLDLPASDRAGAGTANRMLGENPLLLAGLVLAGANRRDLAGPLEEDGILTAEEVASLDLSHVEWAVLSACETGLGKIQPGEGVLGLRRAFEVAGAGTLIMSLWKVDDEATREWMQSLYAERLKGMSTAEAVRAASLAMLKKRRELHQSTQPFYWGAFVASGDWR